MPSEVAETMANYDQIAAEFAAQWGDLRLERALGTFTRVLGGQHHVLDLGCGPGRDVVFLSQLGCWVAGLDLSARMLAEAHRRVPHAALVRGDLRHPPFGPATFDGVWACASLLHLRRSQLSPALAQVSRLLRRPAGVLYLALKGGQGQRWVTGEGDRRAFFAYYQAAEVHTALQKAGFEVIEHWVEPDRAGRDEPWLNFVGRVEIDQ